MKPKKKVIFNFSKKAMTELQTVKDKVREASLQEWPGSVLEQQRLGLQERIKLLEQQNASLTQQLAELAALPNYPQDLNAMHEVENTLTETEQWTPKPVTAGSRPMARSSRRNPQTLGACVDLPLVGMSKRRWIG